MDMVRLAIDANPHFALDSEEMYRSGYTYTNDTLAILTAQHPDTDYYFIIGADSLMAFDTWYRPDGICAHCILAVAVRDQLAPEMLTEKMDELREKYQAGGFFCSRRRMWILHRAAVRDVCREGRSIRYYVTDEVLVVYPRQSDLQRGKNNGIQSDKNAEKAEKIRG